MIFYFLFDCFYFLCKEVILDNFHLVAIANWIETKNNIKLAKRNKIKKMWIQMILSFLTWPYGGGWEEGLYWPYAGGA